MGKGRNLIVTWRAEPCVGPARYLSVVSFVPVSGPARLRGEDPVTIEFTDAVPGARTVALPVRAALPVLSKAHGRDDVHPSVALFSGAALLGLRLVAAGKSGVYVWEGATPKVDPEVAEMFQTGGSPSSEDAEAGYGVRQKFNSAKSRRLDIWEGEGGPAYEDDI